MGDWSAVVGGRGNGSSVGNEPPCCQEDRIRLESIRIALITPWLLGYGRR